MQKKYRDQEGGTGFRTVEVKLGPGQSFGEEVVLGCVENYEYTITVSNKAELDMIMENDFLNLFRNYYSRVPYRAVRISKDSKM